jgi:phospholipase/carboxylesterase
MKKLLLLSIFILITLSVFGQGTVLNEDLALRYLIQPPVAEVGRNRIIIMLHGYGSDEKDLYELKTFFPGFFIISVRAPHSAGASGYQWFPIGSVNSNNTGKNEQLEKSTQQLKTFITQVIKKYGKGASAEVYLAGFSQGAMMSYAVGLTNPGLVKGIAVLSGRLFPSLKQEIKISPALKNLKIFISHGTKDDRIPFSEGKAAGDYLKSIGLKPEFHEYAGMGHSISNTVLNDLVSWLK